MSDIIAEKSAEERGIVSRLVGGVIASKTVAKSLTQRVYDALPVTKEQRLRVKQVGAVNFRANWYAPQDDGNTVKSWRMIDSQFLRVTDHGQTLEIRNVTK
jgi:hypothetical protein